MLKGKTLGGGRRGHPGDLQHVGRACVGARPGLDGNGQVVWNVAQKLRQGAAQKQSLDECAAVAVCEPNKARFGFWWFRLGVQLGLNLFVRCCCLALGLPVAASRTAHVARGRVALRPPGELEEPSTLQRSKLLFRRLALCELVQLVAFQASVRSSSGAL